MNERFRLLFIEKIANWNSKHISWLSPNIMPSLSNDIAPGPVIKSGG